MGTNSMAKTAGSHAEILRERYFFWVVLFVTALSYVGTLQFDFVFDDYDQILYNPFVKSWKYVPQYFTSGVWKQMSAVAPGNYYRPMFMIWTRLNYALFSIRPLGWHVGAVLLHVIVTALVYWAVHEMTGQARIAWLTALIFGVHPIHHEVVAWISGATESLFAVFFLAAFLAYLRSRKEAKTAWMAVSCVLFTVALLCKETAIVLPALVCVYGWIAGDTGDAGAQGTSGGSRRWLQPIWMALVYVPVVPIYLAARYKALMGFSHAEQYVSISQWLRTLPSILFFYLKHWLFPIHLAEFYDVYYQNHVNLGQVVLPSLVLIAIAAALWMLRNRLGSRELGYAVAWIVIPLLPALDTFIFAPNELVHDRYFYVPSIGAALLVALIVEHAMESSIRVFRQPLHVVVSALALAVILALCTARASSFWSDDYTLYRRGHEIAPLNSTATVNLGTELLDRKDVQSAETLLETGYLKNSGDYHFAFGLGRVQYTKKQYPLAEAYIRQVISLNPIFPDAYVYLSQIELKQGRAAEAQINLRNAVTLAPDMPVYHTAYGIVLELNGDCKSAMSQFETALALNPGDGITQREMFRCRRALATASGDGTKSGQR